MAIKYKHSPWAPKGTDEEFPRVLPRSYALQYKPCCNAEGCCMSSALPQTQEELTRCQRMPTPSLLTGCWKTTSNLGLGLHMRLSQKQLERKTWSMGLHLDANGVDSSCSSSKAEGHHSNLYPDVSTGHCRKPQPPGPWQSCAVPRCPKRGANRADTVTACDPLILPSKQCRLRKSSYRAAIVSDYSG